MTRSFLLTMYAPENIGFPRLADYFVFPTPDQAQSCPAARLTRTLLQTHRRNESSGLWSRDGLFGSYLLSGSEPQPSTRTVPPPI